MMAANGIDLDGCVVSVIIPFAGLPNFGLGKFSIGGKLHILALTAMMISTGRLVSLSTTCASTALVSNHLLAITLIVIYGDASFDDVDEDATV